MKTQPRGPGNGYPCEHCCLQQQGRNICHVRDASNVTTQCFQQRMGCSQPGEFSPPPDLGCSNVDSNEFGGLRSPSLIQL